MAAADQQDEAREGARSDVDRLNHPAIVANRQLHGFCCVCAMRPGSLFPSVFLLGGEFQRACLGLS
jgi:hypothetical protein